MKKKPKFKKGDLVKVLGKKAWDLFYKKYQDGCWDYIRAYRVGKVYKIEGQYGDNPEKYNLEDSVSYWWPASCLEKVKIIRRKNEKETEI